MEVGMECIILNLSWFLWEMTLWPTYSDTPTVIPLGNSSYKYCREGVTSRTCRQRLRRCKLSNEKISSRAECSCSFASGILMKYIIWVIVSANSMWSPDKETFTFSWPFSWVYWRPLLCVHHFVSNMFSLKANYWWLLSLHFPYFFRFQSVLQFSFSFGPKAEDILNKNKNGKHRKSSFLWRWETYLVEINPTDILLNVDPILLHPRFYPFPNGWGETSFTLSQKCQASDNAIVDALKYYPSPQWKSMPMSERPFCVSAFQLPTESIWFGHFAASNCRLLSHNLY